MIPNEIQVGQLSKDNSILQVLICDDNRSSLQNIHKKVTEVLYKLNVKADIGLFTRRADISEDMLRRCDIALLDIDFEGSGYSGIDIARTLRQVNEKALILFVTNYIEYAPEGYEVQAFRYILKRDIDQVMGRYIMQALEVLSYSKDVLQFQSKGEIIELPFNSILYLEVIGHNVSVFAQNGQCYTLSASLSSFERQLESHGFLRVHKSFLVNMRHIKKFQCRELTLDNGSLIRVSEKSYAEQKRKYLLWKGWQ